MNFRSIAILTTAACLSTPLFAEETTLKQQLDARKAAGAAKSSPERQAMYADGIKQVAESGIYDKALNVGDKAPDFTLKNHEGDPVTLSEVLAEGPVVLTWYRGGWCPYCNIALAALQEKLPEFKAEGAQLVALTPELPDYASETVEKNGLDFHVLSDLQNKVADQYGLVFKMADGVAKAMRENAKTNERNDDESDTLPLAATYVIYVDGVIRYAFLDANYVNRAEPQVILDELKALKSE